LLSAAVWSGMLLIAISNPHVARTEGEVTLMGVCFLGFTLSAAFGVRLARSGLWMAPDGIVVRGPLKTWTLTLGDVERVVPGVQKGIGSGTPCPMFKLKRTWDRPIGVWALGREGPASRHRGYLDDMRLLCDALDELLQSLSTMPAAAQARASSGWEIPHSVGARGRAASERAADGRGVEPLRRRGLNV
jgi:hypothetical protein